MSIFRWRSLGTLRTSVLGMSLQDGEGKGCFGAIAPRVNFCCPALSCKRLLFRTGGCGFRLTTRWNCFTGRNQLGRVDIVYVSLTAALWRQTLPPRLLAFTHCFAVTLEKVGEESVLCC